MQLIRMLSMLWTLACAAASQDAPRAKVTFPILIEDSHHHPAANVTHDSLVIKQHKVAITDFSLVSTANLPLQLGVLVDISSSERQTGLQDIFKASLDFAK